VLLLVACSSGGDGSTEPPGPPEDTTSIEAQIRTLYQPDAQLREAALSQAAAIRQQIAAGGNAAARTRVLLLADFTLRAFRDGKLAGGTSLEAERNVTRLVGALYQLAGMQAPVPAEGTLSVDAATGVVGPEGGQLVTPSGAAGVQIPAGALPESVLVAVTRIPTPASPGTGPLPTELKQYGPYYDLSTYPNVPQFGDSMRVGICQVTNPSSPFYPPEPHDRLRLAHRVGNSVEILERVGVNDFLRCTNVSPMIASSGEAGWRTVFTAVVERIVSELTPGTLHAAHGGLGGKVKSFSPFGAVITGSEFQVSPRSAFLRTIDNDAPEPPLILDLQALGIAPGSRVLLERLGSYSFVPTPPEDGLRIIGVFSSSTTLLATNVQFRVPGAIGVGIDFQSQPLGSTVTDIPEDFRVENLRVTVPAGARYLFVAGVDVFYSDNRDVDNDLKVRITPINP
jgi:hypothetical protein